MLVALLVVLMVGVVDATGCIATPGMGKSFTKPDFANYTLAENQDRIQDGFWITRGSSHALFNIAVETTSLANSPKDTFWSLNTTEQVFANISNPDFSSYTHFQEACRRVGGCHYLQNKTLSMWLAATGETNLFHDVSFVSFDSSTEGAGFSYTRVLRVGCGSIQTPTPVPSPSPTQEPECDIVINSPAKEFHKAGNSSATDYLFEDVRLGRGSKGGLINVFAEHEYNPGVSPAFTLWSPHPTMDSQAHSYTTFDTVCAVDFGGCAHLVNHTVSMRLLSHELYYDVTFLEWRSDGSVSYSRILRLHCQPQPNSKPPDDKAVLYLIVISFMFVGGFVLVAKLRKRDQRERRRKRPTRARERSRLVSEKQSSYSEEVSSFNENEQTAGPSNTALRTIPLNSPTDKTRNPAETSLDADDALI